jgi:hypothetical protein
MGIVTGRHVSAREDSAEGAEGRQGAPDFQHCGEPARQRRAGGAAPRAIWARSTIRRSLRGANQSKRSRRVRHRETRAPEGVGLCVRGGVDGVRSGRDGQPRLRRWTKPLMPSQVALKRRSRVWPRGHRSVFLVGLEWRCFAFADRRDDRRRVEWITPWTPHGSSRLFRVRQENRAAARVSIPDILME